MYLIETDKDKNRLYMKLEGFLHEEEIMNASNELKTKVLTLSPGFDVINDISKFNPATARGREIIKEAQIFIVQRKVNRVVRITDNVIGKIQFERSSREAGYTAVAVSSLEEAHNFLEQEQT